MAQVYNSPIGHLTRMRSSPTQSSRAGRKIDEVLRRAYRKFDRSAETQKLLQRLLK